MKRLTPKLDSDGNAILHSACCGFGCVGCNYEGVELEENEKYWDDKISKCEDEGEF